MLKFLHPLLFSSDFRFNGFKTSFSFILIKALIVQVTLNFRRCLLLQLMMKVIYFFKQIRCKSLQLSIEPEVPFKVYLKP